MKLETLKDLYIHELKDLYSAETQLVRALPKMAKAASTPELKKAFEQHLKETERQVARLDKIAKRLDVKLSGKVCAAMKGLIEEGKEVIEEDGEGPVIDAALIAAAQRVEHYEISAYGTVRAIAEELGEDEVAKLLQQTLDEESATDEKLTKISVEQLLPAASKEAEEGGDEEDED